MKREEYHLRDLKYATFRLITGTLHYRRCCLIRKLYQFNEYSILIIFFLFSKFATKSILIPFMELQILHIIRIYFKHILNSIKFLSLFFSLPSFKLESNLKYNFRSHFQLAQQL